MDENKQTNKIGGHFLIYKDYYKFWKKRLKHEISNSIVG